MAVEVRIGQGLGRFVLGVVDPHGLDEGQAALGQGAVAGQGMGALGQGEGHDRGQQLGGEAHGQGDREQE